MTAGDAVLSHREAPTSFYAGALSALLAINEVLETADYLEGPKLGASMRALTIELDQFSRSRAERRD